ncbi:MAG TPA: glycosyltransferase [Rhizobiaceae bacterium]|nr:glycosyltransferase [Rhizobiaceae bacterium]
MNSEIDLFEPTISIIIPVYNGANYLREAIDSALAQTYAKVEIIVVDDGSTDNGATRKIAESFGSKITYIRQENGGCGAALNTGISAMTGQYFSWLSHDDLYTPEKLSRQVEILRGLPDKNTIIYGNYDLIDSGSKRFFSMRLEALGTPEQLDIPLYPLTRGIIHGCVLLIPRVLFERYGTFNPALKTTQDYDLWFRLFRHAPIKFDPHTFVLSRVHDEQSSRTQSAMKTEGDALWTRFVEEVTPAEAAAMHGSHHRFLINTANFLEQTPYRDVAAVARAKARSALSETKVTAVIPFKDRVGWTIEALQSARAQTHGTLEIILVDDGSEEDIGPLTRIAEADERIRYIRQDWQGTSAARNAGIRLATGEYIAFLDSDDRWSAEKIESQLHYMAEADLAFSHTGYFRFDERTGETAEIVTDYFKGSVYPRIISFCPIAAPTVMVRTDVMRANLFPDNIHIGEDIISWISIARDHEFGALKAPLTIVRISPGTTSVSTAKSQRGILNILSAVVGHSLHGDHHTEILALIDLVRRYELEREIPPAESPVDLSPPYSAKAGLADRARISWQLTMRGLDSLRRFGFNATWKRVKYWRKARSQ